MGIAPTKPTKFIVFRNGTPGVIVGFVIGFIAALAGFGHLSEPLSTIAGFIVAIPVGIWVVRNILRKKFKTFRIVLVPIDQSSAVN